MAFKQVSGARALLLGIGGFVGIVAAWVGYADLARNFLPADLRVYWPLLMIAGFACALWAVGSVKEEAEPSIVIYHIVDSDRDERSREYHGHYFVMRNVGHFTLTKIRMAKIEVSDLHISFDEIQSLGPGEETKVVVWQLGSLPKTLAPWVQILTMRVKLTIVCDDWKQQERFEMDYELRFGPSGKAFYIDRVRTGETIEWTDLKTIKEAIDGRGRGRS